MDKWEYKTFSRKVEDYELDSLGGKGWELVSHTVTALSGKLLLNTVGGQGSFSLDLSQYYVFKRKLQD